MKKIVILGAGTGGALCANLLSRRLDARQWSITVIDRESRHLYQPGLLFLPLALYGYTSAEDVVRPIASPLPRGVALVHGDIQHIDTAQRVVRTSAGPYEYDFLVSSLGCRVAPEEVEGMAEAMGHGVHTFYTLEGALALQQPLERMREGRLVIDICEMPIKCPVAPLEFAFLADYYFRQKALRERIQISLVTPYTGAFTKPNANRVLSKVAADKGIEVVPNFAAARVDGERRTLSTFDGRSLEYDLLVAIPPNLGPAVLDDSGLGDGAGYGITDPRTLRSLKAERIYLLGDNTNVATSKAGSVAHFEAETVVENLLREIDGQPPEQSFDGHANCFVETGDHKAMLLDFNYDIEPLEGSFPLPFAGPFGLLENTYMNHVGKIAFKWVYWNMLLPGHLPMVPLLPSHMNFLGKDLATAPQMRHAKSLKVADVMTREVLTANQGSSLVALAETMAKRHISGVPILDAESKLVGIVTEADFLSAMNLGGGGLSDLLETVVRKRRARKGMGTIVDDIMTRNPITVAADATLAHAVQLMDRNKIKRLVVTDGHGHVAGIVSRGDLMKLFAMK